MSSINNRIIEALRGGDAKPVLQFIAMGFTPSDKIDMVENVLGGIQVSISKSLLFWSLSAPKLDGVKTWWDGRLEKEWSVLPANDRPRWMFEVLEDVLRSVASQDPQAGPKWLVRTLADHCGPSFQDTAVLKKINTYLSVQENFSEVFDRWLSLLPDPEVFLSQFIEDDQLLSRAINAGKASEIIMYVEDRGLKDVDLVKWGESLEECLLEFSRVTGLFETQISDALDTLIWIKEKLPDFKTEKTAVVLDCIHKGQLNVAKTSAKKYMLLHTLVESEGSSVNKKKRL